MTKARSNVQLAADQRLQEAAAQYVWNKVHGKPMREIARATGVHASTVMRHVRKIENNAEDPKIQALIRTAEAAPMDMDHYRLRLLHPCDWSIPRWKIWPAAKIMKGAHF